MVLGFPRLAAVNIKHNCKRSQYTRGYTDYVVYPENSW